MLEARDHRGFFVPQLSLEDFMEIYELREALEGIASRRAAQSARRTELADQMDALLEEQRAAVAEGDLAAYGELDVQFHQLIWSESGNRRLAGVADNLFGQMRIGNNISAQAPGRPEASLREHAAIVAAVRDGDDRGAERAVRLHVRTAGKALAKLLQSGGRPEHATRDGLMASEAWSEQRG
ncbi:GntR family transcriptional regulator [Arthrobacter sp. JSM 101049]|uniref:GntR family transcriptional regulator n=1 Tax=Arthrobacter sp. JSM 101049 TaxID=929097 RepID=UPI00356155DB